METQPAIHESSVNQKLSNHPIFQMTKRFFIVFVLYISLYLFAKLIFFAIASLFYNANCDPCWLVGIPFILIHLPFLPLFYVEGYLSSLGLSNVVALIALYPISFLLALLLGVLFGGVKNKKISAGILIGTAVIAFLTYQIFVEDIFSKFTPQSKTSSSIDQTQEKKVPDLNTNKTSTNSVEGEVQRGWKIVSSNLIGVKFNVPETWVVKEVDGFIHEGTKVNTYVQSSASIGSISVTKNFFGGFGGYYPIDSLTKEVTIDGYKTFKNYFKEYDYTKSSEEQVNTPEIPVFFTASFTHSDGSKYLITGGWLDKDYPEFDKLSDEILSTIDFY